MVGAFDPGQDRDAKVLTAVPAPPVQDVLLQQAAEEAPHGGVIAGRPDTAHGADHVVAAHSVDESSAAKLTATDANPGCLTSKETRRVIS